MDILLENFTEISNKPIILHKDIPDQRIRLIYGEYKKLYIIDIDDLTNYNNNNYIHNIPKTQYIDPLIKFSYYYTTDFAIYSYLDFRTQDEMNNDHISIKSHNIFLKDSRYKRSSLIAKLNKRENCYYITYYINNNIIESIKKNKRNHKIGLLIDILNDYNRDNLIHDNSKLLYSILKGQIHYQNELIKNLDIFSLSNILKSDIQLYNYQIDDIKWMNWIEDCIKNNKNEITYMYSPAYNVLNNEFVLYDYTLFPVGLINDTFKSKRSFQFFGGNLISEVGLGKTLITLSHVFNQIDEKRDMYNNFVEFTDNCNYFYKRGKLKGQVCKKKKCENTKLYCKEHINTLFVDKMNIKFKNLADFNTNDFIIKSFNKNYIKTNSTLIICPNQLCDQWLQEYYNKFNNNYRVLIIVTYDQYTNVTLADILFSDIIFVSYNFLLNKKYIDNVNNAKNSILLKNFTENTNENTEKLLLSNQFNLFHLFHWRRIICDEIHEVENMLRGNQLKNYLLTLQSNYKWNVTGTPFTNGLYSFINLMSYNTNYIENNKNNYNMEHFSMENLIELGFNSEIIEKTSILFRRNTKQSVVKEYSGNKIIDHVKLLDFTNQERTIYDSYLEGSRKKYSDFLIRLCCHPELNDDTKELIKNCKTLNDIRKVMLEWNKKCLNEELVKMNTYKDEIEYYQNQIDNNIELHNNDDILNEINEPLKIKLVTSKRQLTIHKKNYEEYLRTYNYLKTSIDSLSSDETITCPICLDDIDKDNITITKCGHKFCWDCIYETHKIRKESNNDKFIKCPTCNTLMSNKEIYLLYNNIVLKENSELNEIVQNVKSTKIGNIIYFLKTSITSNDKIIIFSQWDELLHKVGNILESHKINIIYCNGSVYQRKRAITSFCKDKNINVILLSSRNAASGINLTIANKIILLEPIYGSQEYRHNIESQAIGRADRIGQTNPIDIYRFIIKNTIEEDILNNFIDDDHIKHLQI